MKQQPLNLGNALKVLGLLSLVSMAMLYSGLSFAQRQVFNEQICLSAVIEDENGSRNIGGTISPPKNDNDEFIVEIQNGDYFCALIDDGFHSSPGTSFGSKDISLELCIRRISPTWAKYNGRNVMFYDCRGY